MAKSETVETYNPQKIFVKGHTLQAKIYERTKKIEQTRAELLSAIADLIRSACGPEEDPAEKAAGLLIALEEDYNLGAHARSAKSFIQRAAELQREYRDLGRFGRTLMKNAIYELTWEEADRFGL